MKKLSLLCAMLIMACACSNENESATPKTKTEIVQTSSAFRSLGIPESQLEMNNIQTETTPAGHNILILSFKNNGNKILNVLDENGLITVSTLVSVESSVPSKDYYDVFNAKAFEGKISFLSSTGHYYGMDFKQSRIVNYFIATDMIKPGHDNTRTEACSGWTEKGGPLDCAGASIEAEGTFSKITCYMDFIICLGAKVIDCMRSGCMMPPTSYGTIVVNGIVVQQVVTPSMIFDPAMVVKTPTRITNINPVIFNQ